MAQRRLRARAQARPLLQLLIAAFVGRFVCWSIGHAFAGSVSRPCASVAVTRRAGFPGLENLDMKAYEELMKDPEKMKGLKAEVNKIMEDPEKRKVFEDFQTKMQSAVKSMEDDPELKDILEDVRKNGPEAMKKYEKNEALLQKFSKAMGGPQGMPGMQGMAGGAPAATSPKTFKPGDEVIIQGLAKAPELNGKKEKDALAGTGRLIVRLLDTGDQFAVKPDNLRTTADEVDDLMTKNLEDVSLFNPALQTEAAKLRDSGKLDDLQNDPELKPIFEDIKKNGMAALEKYWEDEALMKKINKALAAGGR